MCPRSALLLVAILIYFDPAQGDDPYPVVRRLVDALPSGSYVALSHPTGDFNPEAASAVSQVLEQAGMTMLPRSRDQVAAFLDGLELVEPGVAPPPVLPGRTRLQPEVHRLRAPPGRGRGVPGPGLAAGRIGIEAQIEDALGLTPVEAIAAASPRPGSGRSCSARPTGGHRGAVMLGDEMIDEASRKMALVVGKGRAAGLVRGSNWIPPAAPPA